MVFLPWKDGNAAGFICGPRSMIGPTCRFCGRLANKRCDWDVGELIGTCSSWICDAHAESIADDIDLCPDHSRKFHNPERHHPAITATLLRGLARKQRAAAKERKHALHQAQGDLFSGGTDA